ncbi:hypothetical protein GCM10027046_11690 [Uliginosibacterium flavum]|uniref:DUF2235 domain-containing protein n=1 Tax=Uliginosibacterium flavum TaxID=1396831 RepID=A0ABV2TQI4_9RHOO
MSGNKQRLVVFFDGTWNDPQDRTNVFRMCSCLADYDEEVPQRFFYDPGVGTSKLTRLQGGMFGTGLSKNLMEGYDWLARRYMEGDEIWVFGFSRGAYTARSLVGLLRKCGLLHVSTPDLQVAAEKLYRDKSAGPDDPPSERFRRQYSREVKVYFIGVWDTVGSLGIPGTMISERGLYSWHDTQLSKIVEHAYQAMALDEHRAPYDVVQWVGENGLKKPENVDVEQRWFIGAHADVGGGYGDNPLADDNPLSDISLLWMQQKAVAAGLKFVPVVPAPKAFKTEPHDSFREFAGGAYAVLRGVLHAGDGRFYRCFEQECKDSEGKVSRGVNVTVDPSVWQRWASVPDYRPPTLVAANKSAPY